MHYVFDTVLYIFCNTFKIFHAVGPNIAPTGMNSSLLAAVLGGADVIYDAACADGFPVVHHGGFLTGVESLKSLAVKLPGVVSLESFYYALIEGLDERGSVWGHEENFYVGAGIFKFLVAMN